MEIKVSVRHGNLSDKNQQIIIDKVSKLTDYFNRLTEIEVIVDLAHNGNPHVELLVEAEHKHDFVASLASDDLMGAVDLVVDKMAQQIKKHKQKIQSHNREKPNIEREHPNIE